MNEPITLHELMTGASAAERLAAAGFATPAAEVKARLFAQAASGLAADGGGGDVFAFWVPGRIEVLGKHTDYAGGSSLLAATERGFGFVARPRSDQALRVIDAARGEAVAFPFEAELTPASGHWSNYPMTVARRLARNFAPPLTGVDVAFASDLPPASGMSSSSALMIGTYLALDAANRFAESDLFRANIHGREELAEYLGTVENGQSYRGLAGDRGVGTFGGSEDHTAILCCQGGKLSRYRYCPTRFEALIDLPTGHLFAVAMSGVVADKTGSAREQYNRASALAGEVAELWRRSGGGSEAHLKAILDSRADAVAAVHSVLEAGGGRFSSRELLDRFEHFVAENEEILPAACAALSAGDVAAFGAWVDRSQALGATLLRNGTPETLALAASARELGAAAASAFGAGFGGSTWALVPQADAASFLARWRARYVEAFPAPAAQSAFFLTQPAPAALRLGV